MRPPTNQGLINILNGEFDWRDDPGRRVLPFDPDRVYRFGDQVAIRGLVYVVGFDEATGADIQAISDLCDPEDEP